MREMLIFGTQCTITGITRKTIFPYFFGWNLNEIFEVKLIRIIFKSLYFGSGKWDVLLTHWFKILMRHLQKINQLFDYLGSNVCRQIHKLSHGQPWQKSLQIA